MIVLLSILIFISATLTIWAKTSARKVLTYIFKPLTMILIIALAVFSTSNSIANYKILIIAGLLFSLVGDVLLIEKSRFVYGLISFLIAHLFYIGAFFPNAQNVKLLSVLPFVVYVLIFLSVLWSGLGKLKIPVIFYASMGFCAVNRYLFNQTESAFYAMSGAIFFMASDSILAFDKFKRPLKFADFWVLSSYFAAQWLIAQ
jgi:uncharacterized membrane protein YhhN